MITKLAILASLAIFSLIAITPSSFAAEPYVSGSIVTSDEYPPWDRYIDVNGLRILGLPSLDGGNVVSDEFMEKVARTVQLLLDPNAPDIDLAAQIAAMNGMANNCSREGGYPQGFDSTQYGLTLQRTFGDDFHMVIFYSVIDDIEESITDVIRGEDHITNTALHIQIFEALNAPVPLFGHHPFLTDEKGKGLGKRLGGLSIKSLKDKGFENITLLNYLLSVGTSKNISNEKNIDTLYKSFNINHLAKSSPKFSLKVLENLNKEILQSYEFSEIKQKFHDQKLLNASNDFWIFAKNNINYFSDVLYWWKIINNEEIYPTKDQYYLNIASQLLPDDPFDITTWKKWTSKISVKTNRSGKELYLPLRLALTGQKKGPELKFLMPLLNKKQILMKLRS